MYQVITMFGDNEPWWFLKTGKKILKQKKHSSLWRSTTSVQKQWIAIHQNYEYINAKSNFLSAFWNDGDERWCEECDDDLQQYKGLALLKNHQPITVESRKEFYETTNTSGKTKRCERPKQVLGANQKHKNYYEGPKVIVTWALGHLLGLKMPEDLNKEWQSWQMDTLPMIPKN